MEGPIDIHDEEVWAVVARVQLVCYDNQARTFAERERERERERDAEKDWLISWERKQRNRKKERANKN